jgi:hypothetical protein
MPTDFGAVAVVASHRVKPERQERIAGFTSCSTYFFVRRRRRDTDGPRVRLLNTLGPQVGPVPLLRFPFVEPVARGSTSASNHYWVARETAGARSLPRVSSLAQVAPA